MKTTAIPLILILTLALTLGACANKAQQGAVLGTATGAAVGGLVAGDKVEGAAIGAGVGLLLGYIIGNEMDKYDRQQVSQTLEYTPTGQTTNWRNPDTGSYYEATPSAPYTTDGRVYRDIQIQTTVDGQPEVVNAKAYRNPDGSWQLVQ